MLDDEANLLGFDYFDNLNEVYDTIIKMLNDYLNNLIPMRYR